MFVLLLEIEPIQEVKRNQYTEGRYSPVLTATEVAREGSRLGDYGLQMIFSTEHKSGNKKRWLCTF